VNDRSKGQEWRLSDLAEDTAVGGNLESTVGILSRILVMIRFIMVGVGVVVACPDSLVEKMMDPVRR
jgi:hypothetical protein